MSAIAKLAAEEVSLADPRLVDGDAPLVSAIIPCLNEERTLGICISRR
jgi:cellulose synthase/poly-beta-1,6-N-acetylglucosamine synthase-like glycosyltransferase